MATHTIVLDGSINVSCNIGDDVWYTQLTAQNIAGRNNPGNINQPGVGPMKLGNITAISYVTNTIVVNDPMNNAIGTWHYFMFSKNKVINTSGITGYYSLVEYRNEGTLPAEMFATALDFVESSK
tara:strand:- start:635 stop:1009 length:375 start_codon:yes stop_codon:yes gene_type:complete